MGRRDSPYARLAEVLAAAILDRLLHHSFTLMIQGESFRLKQKRKALALPQELGRNERLWRARLADLLSGMSIDSNTSEPLPGVHADDGLAELRGEVERACARRRGSAECDTPTIRQVRALLALPKGMAEDPEQMGVPKMAR